MSKTPIELAFEKLKEADFFLGLITILSHSHQPLPTPPTIEFGGGETKTYEDRFTVEAQMSYLLSAFSNACYSAVRQVGKDFKFREMTKKYCSDNPIFYASGPDGGIRTKNTHFGIVKAMGALNVPRESEDPLDAFMEDDEGWEKVETDLEDFPFEIAQKYYISDRNPQDSIELICSAQHMDLHNFLVSCWRETSK